MKPLLEELRSIALARKKTVSQIALNWNLQKGFLVLVGIRSVPQAMENLGSLLGSRSNYIYLDIILHYTNLYTTLQPLRVFSTQKPYLSTHNLTCMF